MVRAHVRVAAALVTRDLCPEVHFFQRVWQPARRHYFKMMLITPNLTKGKSLRLHSTRCPFTRVVRPLTISYLPIHGTQSFFSLSIYRLIFNPIFPRNGRRFTIRDVIKCHLGLAIYPNSRKSRHCMGLLTGMICGWMEQLQPVGQFSGTDLVRLWWAR